MNAASTDASTAPWARTKHCLALMLAALATVACEERPTGDYLIDDPAPYRTAVAIPIRPTPAPTGSPAFTLWGEQSLDGSDVVDFALDGEGPVVWIATAHGLWRFDTSTLAQRHLTQRDGLHSNALTAIHVDDDGIVWLGSEDRGLARFDPAEEATVVEDGGDGMSTAEISYITSDGHGGLWVSSVSTVWHRNIQGAWRTFHPEIQDDPHGEDGTPSRVRRLAVDSDGGAWFVVDAAAFHIALTGQIVKTALDFGETSADRAGPAAVRVMPDGALWFAYMTPPYMSDSEPPTGLFRLKPDGSVTHISSDWNFESVFDIVPTADDGIVVPTENGIFRHHAGRWVYPGEDGDQAVVGADGGVGAELIGDGSIWFASRMGLSRRASDGTWRQWPLGALEQPRIAGRIAIASTGWVWSGDPLHARTSDGSIALPAESNVRIGSVLAPLLLVEDGLWLGDHGLAWLGTDGRRKRYTIADGLASDDIWALARDRDDALWIGTIEGLSRRTSDGAWTTELRGEHVTGIAVEDDGTVWASLGYPLEALRGFTSGKPLARRDADGSWSFVDVLPGTHDAGIGIVQSRDGTLWLALAEHGLMHRPNGLTWMSVARTTSGNEAALHWSTATGLHTARDSDGIWVDYGDRMVHVSPDGSTVLAVAHRDITDAWRTTASNDASAADVAGARALLDRIPLDLSLRFAPRPYNGDMIDDVLDAAVGPDGTRWLAIGHGRLLEQHPSGVWRAHTLAPVLPRRASMLAAAPDGSVWLASTCAALIHRTADGTMQAIDVANGLPVTGVAMLAVDGEGGVWVGPNHECLPPDEPGRPGVPPTRSGDARHLIGAYRSPDGKWRYFRDVGWSQQMSTSYSSDALAVHTARDVLGRSRTTAWFVVNTALLRREPNGAWNWFDVNDGLEIEYPYPGLAIDTDGDAWISAGDGIARVDDKGGVTMYTMRDRTRVQDVAAAPDGSIWVTNAWPSGQQSGYPEGGVLRRFPDGTWWRYGPEHGLPDDKALDVEVDADGVVWVKTFADGLARLDPGE